MAISSGSEAYFILERVLSKEEIAAPRIKRPWFAVTRNWGFFLFEQRFSGVDILAMTPNVVIYEMNY